METLIKLINSLLALGGAVYGYYRFHNFAVAALAYLAVYELAKAIGAVVLMYYYRGVRKKDSALEMGVFEERNFDKEFPQYEERDVLELGIRVLVVTEGLVGDKYLDYFREMERTAIESLDQENTIFNLRYHIVIDKELPYQSTWCVCGKDGKYMNRCVKIWHKKDALVLRTLRDANRDMFIYDGEMEVEDKGNLRYSVVIEFDHSLPVTVRNPQQIES